MKRLFLHILTVALLALSGAAYGRGAAAAPGKTTVTPSSRIVTDRRTSAMNFTSVKVANMISLTVEDRTDDVIVIRANENLLPYVRLSVSKGCLEARLDNDIIVRGGNRYSVDISIPNNGRISSVEVSGASALRIMPVMRVADFEAEVSGASSLEVNVETESCEFDVSGASSLSFGCEGGRLALDVSGASSAKGSVRSLKSNIEVSGASSVHLDGKSSGADIEVSGTSTFSGFGFETEVCKVEVSGVSRADILCTGSLSAVSSGMSKIEYAGECRMASVSTSGMGKIKRK